MAKEKAPEPDNSGDVPEWFMTYSDVITLLMTFFILLLTFASNEPEQFERLKTSMFSGTGGTGVAGERVDGMERESFVVRTRPHVSRLAMRGSEMPPIEEDPPIDTVDKGLAGLEDDEMRPVTPRNAIRLPLSLLLESDQNTVSSVGAQHLKMVARQTRRPGYHLVMGIHPEDDPLPLMSLANFLIRQGGLKPGQIAFATSPAIKRGSGRVQLEVIREERGS